ncbi:hypothetical protein [Desulforhopalus sp. 52FAK]
MSEILLLQKKQDRTFLLVCINFLLFMVLFAGFGIVVWKSATLVSRLSSDLTRAEETIGQLHQRFQAMDTTQLVDRIAQNASQQLGESIQSSLSGVDLSTPITNLSDKVVVTQEMLEKSGETLQAINTNVAQLDNDVIARKVADYVLQGLRQGVNSSAQPLTIQKNN